MSNNYEQQLLHNYRNSIKEIPDNTILDLIERMRLHHTARRLALKNKKCIDFYSKVSKCVIMDIIKLGEIISKTGNIEVLLNYENSIYIYTDIGYHNTYSEILQGPILRSLLLGAYMIKDKSISHAIAFLESTMLDFEDFDIFLIRQLSDWNLDFTAEYIVNAYIDKTVYNKPRINTLKTILTAIEELIEIKHDIIHEVSEIIADILNEEYTALKKSIIDKKCIEFLVKCRKKREHELSKVIIFYEKNHPDFFDSESARKKIEMSIGITDEYITYEEKSTMSMTDIPYAMEKLLSVKDMERLESFKIEHDLCISCGLKTPGIYFSPTCCRNRYGPSNSVCIDCMELIILSTNKCLVCRSKLMLSLDYPDKHDPDDFEPEYLEYDPEHDYESDY